LATQEAEVSGDPEALDTGRSMQMCKSRELGTAHQRCAPINVQHSFKKELAMATQIVMDRTGDARHEFNATDAVALAEAEARFNELTGAGFTAAARKGEGRSELLRGFDPSVEETVFFPRLQGG
jgi:hypothetical protein